MGSVSIICVLLGQKWSVDPGLRQLKESPFKNPPPCPRLANRDFPGTTISSKLYMRLQQRTPRSCGENQRG